MTRRGPADPAILAAVAEMRRRLAHARDAGERRVLRESLKRWQEMADASREALPPKSEPPKP